MQVLGGGAGRHQVEEGSLRFRHLADPVGSLRLPVTPHRAAPTSGQLPVGGPNGSPGRKPHAGACTPRAESLGRSLKAGPRSGGTGDSSAGGRGYRARQPLSLPGRPHGSAESEGHVHARLSSHARASPLCCLEQMGGS